VTLRRVLSVVVLCAAIVLFKATQASTNPSELHRALPQAAGAPTLYQSVVERCQELIGNPERRPWCGELTYAPGFTPSPTVAQAAVQGVREFADPTHGVGLSDKGPLDWRWNYSTGLWGGHYLQHWWQSAMAVRTLVRYLEVTNNTDPAYHQILMRTYHREVLNPFAIAKPYFANAFLDDTAWWGLAWLAASKYELNYRHDVADARTFLRLAEYDSDYIAKQRKSCGGLVWQIGFPSDTVTNAEYISLVAELATYRNQPGPFHDPAKASRWIGQARATLDWLESRNLINLRAGTVRDALNAACNGFIGGPITYTEGEVAEALVRVGTALHDSSYYAQANQFLKFARSEKSTMVNSKGILQEPCERATRGCTGTILYYDELSWKGILVQAFADYTAATGSTEYHGFLRRQASAIVHNSIVRSDGTPGDCQTPDSCEFVFYWGWPLTPSRSPFVNHATQMNALDALTAALSLPANSGTQQTTF
jgi:Glycosyl hydrolase family 76